MRIRSDFEIETDDLSTADDYFLKDKTDQNKNKCILFLEDIRNKLY